MCNIEKVVFECCRTVICDNGIQLPEISPNTKLSRDNGFDSLGIVTLVLLVEEELGIELDDYLFEIRNCETIHEFANVIQKCS